MKICLQGIDKQFMLNSERIKVLENITLTVAKGEFAALLGPSGCGKSTLLSLIAGYFSADAGTVTLNGSVGYMPQRDMLLRWRTVVENVCLPVEVRDKAALPATRKRVRELLPLFGLSGFGDSLPDQLSGGMRQRAALMRTFMAGGDFWLLDEPFGKLDALTKESMQDWLGGIWREFQPGVLFVTHDIDEALKLAQRVYVLSDRPGRLVGDWPVAPELSLLKQAELKEKIRAVLAEKNLPPESPVLPASGAYAGK